MKTVTPFLNFNEVYMPRRQFVKGMAMGGALLGLGVSPVDLLAGSDLSLKQPTLRGNQFNLNLDSLAVNFTGNERVATAVNDSVPGPILRWQEGEQVTLNVSNRLTESSSIHWHGMILPTHMDGVPDISFKGIEPGETFRYQFDVRQSGTFWYHSHSGFQEQTGVYGAIIIDPLEPAPFSYDREYVILLSDWSDENPTDIYAKLKKLSHYYNFAERTTADLMRDLKQKGVSQTWAERGMWNQMRMSDRDLSDVTGYTYTFLMNGQTPADGWSGLFRKGEKVRLRIINGSAMSFFDVRIPGLTMTVVAADGQNIEPVSVDEFRIGVAETYDVIVSPKGDRAYCIFAQALDRTGYARGTLTPSPSLTIDVPELDPYPILTHQDMGMDMSKMHMSHATMGHKDMNNLDMSDLDRTNLDMTDMDMSDLDMSDMDMNNTQGDMGDMSGMSHKMHDMSAMNASKHQMTGTALNMSGASGQGSNAEIIHAKTEFGPHVDGRAQSPQYRLDDPGVGLLRYK